MMLLGIPFLCAAKAWHAYSAWTARQTCRMAGHDASWVLGVALGHDRPVCTRCREVIA